MTILGDFLTFWGLRKQKAVPTELDLYQETWKNLLTTLAAARMKEREARIKVESIASQIDLIEALMFTHPAQQARMQTAYTKAKDLQNDKDF